MKISFVLQSLVTALFVGQASAFFFRNNEDTTLADAADRLGLNTLVAFATLADEALLPILDRLTGDEPTTVFAPTDRAFRALPEATQALLEGDPSILVDVLLYHVVDGKVPASAIPEDPTEVDTLLAGASVVVEQVNFGPFCFFFFCPKTVKVNESRVVIKDVEANKGVIHVIDKVLMPPGIVLSDIVGTAVSNGLSDLVQAVGAADLAETLQSDGPFTVFAPSNEAFGNLPAGLLASLLEDSGIDTLSDILLYHVIVGSSLASGDIVSGSVEDVANGDTVTLQLNGGNVLIQDSTGVAATVIAPDVSATNGIVHVIDKVLIPPGVTVPKDIVEIAQGDASLKSLVDALIDVDLVDALDSAGPFTILAPTNDAFAAIGDTTTLDDGALKDILLYHVIAGKVTSNIVAALGSAETLNGEVVDISTVGGELFINQARVIETDIIASNGVIHKIDSVLEPPEPQCRFFDFICAILGFFGFY